MMLKLNHYIAINKEAKIMSMAKQTIHATISIKDNVNSIVHNKEIQSNNFHPFEKLIHAQRQAHGDPDSFIINLKYKTVNFKIGNFTFQFKNPNPCEGYIIVEFFPVVPMVKVHERDGYIGRFSLI